jgi:outer membrane protein OmpA-like peptidoglycan-associated protein
MSRTAKCSNFENCIIAYRNETVTLDDDAELVCPECGKPVKVIAGKGGGNRKLKIFLVMFAFLAVLAAILGVGFWISIKRLTPTGEAKELKPEPINGPATEVQPEETPAAASNEERAQEPEVSESVAQTDVALSEVPEAVSVPESIDLNTRSVVNQQVKEEVLKRIDLMPTISPVDKDQLYVSVERARQMGKMITIPFAFGNKTLSPDDISKLRAALEEPQIQSLLADPTAVFVVLGYADTRGDPEKNLKISLDRANVVLSALRNLGVVNVMHSVGMGGSTMFDEEGLEKNRVVEVWAVLP